MPSSKLASVASVEPDGQAVIDAVPGFRDEPIAAQPTRDGHRAMHHLVDQRDRVDVPRVHGALGTRAAREHHPHGESPGRGRVGQHHVAGRAEQRIVEAVVLARGARDAKVHQGRTLPARPLHARCATARSGRVKTILQLPGVVEHVPALAPHGVRPGALAVLERDADAATPATCSRYEAANDVSRTRRDRP